MSSGTLPRWIGDCPASLSPTDQLFARDRPEVLRSSTDVRRPAGSHTAGMTTKPPVSPTTTAFQVQAALSFAVSVIAVGVAIWAMPADPWIRAFLAVGMLYVTTSAFTLAKVVRDNQETSAVLSRVDQARLEKLLAEHDPFRVEPIS
jgi:hypothetical protein